jgi:hypothetical protein
MRMRVCYLDCHEGGFCFCLLVHIDNLLRPLQLFRFYLWLIYWLSLVHTKSHEGLFRSSKFVNGRYITSKQPSDLLSPFLFLQSEESWLKTICILVLRYLSTDFIRGPWAKARYEGYSVTQGFTGPLFSTGRCRLQIPFRWQASHFHGLPWSLPAMAWISRYFKLDHDHSLPHFFYC